MATLVPRNILTLVAAVLGHARGGLQAYEERLELSMDMSV